MFYLFLPFWFFIFVTCTPPAQKRSLSAVKDRQIVDGSSPCDEVVGLNDADRKRKECLALARQAAANELDHFLKVELPQRKKLLSTTCDDEQRRVYDTCSGGSQYVRELCLAARDALQNCRARQKSGSLILNSVEKNKREQIDLTHRQAIYKCENEYAAALQCLD